MGNLFPRSTVDRREFGFRRARGEGTKGEERGKMVKRRGPKERGQNDIGEEGEVKCGLRERGKEEGMLGRRGRRGRRKGGREGVGSGERVG
jgi:hypothetical protein